MRRLLLLAVVLVACEMSGTPPTPSLVAPSSSQAVTATAPPSQAAPETGGCPVTLPATSWVADLAGVRPLPASRFSWYGDTKVLAVDLPIDGVYRVSTTESTLGAKVPWWRYLSGTVDIIARRVDGTAPEIRTTSADGYGSNGFNPSEIRFPSEGCWSVTGSLQGHELTFVMFLRRTAPRESAP